MNLTDAALEAGISPRQTNHWFHEGWIKPVLTKRNGEPAPEGADPRGYRWELDEAGLRHLAIMADLVRLGVYPSEASRLAGDFIYDGKKAVHGRLVTIALTGAEEGA